MIKLAKPTIDVGYSSHGVLCSFSEIIELEQDRENEPFIDYAEADISELIDRDAIWLTSNPYNAFLYSLPADYYDMNKEDVIAEFPHWREEVVEFDLSHYELVLDTDDGDDGNLYLFKQDDVTTQ